MSRRYSPHIDMRPPYDNAEAVNPAEPRDQALNLRESVNSSPARMSAQQERLAKLRREIAAMRALIDQPLPIPARLPAAAASPAPISNPPRPAPFVKEAAPVSAAAGRRA